MKAEKIIISFLASLIGIFVAGIAFYLYQATKAPSTSETKTITISPPTPTQSPSSFIFIVDTPKDEEVVSNKTLIISGKTIPEAAIIISTALGDEVVTPSKNGSFSTSVTLEDNQNHIEMVAVAPNGEEKKIVKTVTYSTESF